MGPRQYVAVELDASVPATLALGRHLALRMSSSLFHGLNRYLLSTPVVTLGLLPNEERRPVIDDTLAVFETHASVSSERTDTFELCLVHFSDRIASSSSLHSKQFHRRVQRSLQVVAADRVIGSA